MQLTPKPHATNYNIPCGALSINQFCQYASIKRTKYYELVAAKEIIPRRIGGKPVILMRDAEAWLNALPEMLK